MKRVDDAGRELVRSITVRVFNIGNKGSYVTKHRARPGHGFSEAETDRFLDGVADQIEKRFPGHTYEMVELGEGRFNFVWRGGPDQSPVQVRRVETVSG